jgi:hypothetical protein
MREVSKEAIHQACKLHKRMSPEKVKSKICYSFDHCKVHECPELLESMASIKPSQRVKVPPISPDFQQPVEHAHGRFKEAFKLAITTNPGLRSKERVKEFATKLWFQVNPPEVVNKDVERLLGLYQFVNDKGKGGYAPKSLS